MGSSLTAAGFFSFFRTIPASGPFEVCGLKFRGIPLPHGNNSTCLGFQFGSVVYLSDVSHIPDRVMEFLMTLPVLRLLIIDALRIKDTNPSHMNLPQALSFISAIKPDRAVLTGCSHEFFYADVSRVLARVCAKEGIRVKMGYDMLAFKINSDEF